MAKASRATAEQAHTTAPSLAHESLYVGVDIAKSQHIAGFVSHTLLSRHGRFEGCPALKFANSRMGFRLLIDRIRDYVPLEQCFVLMEKTGHYHRALQEYLLEMDVSVYVMHVHARPRGMVKTDKRDALGLANNLYNQLEKGAQMGDRTEIVHRAVPPTEAASLLKGLMGHRYELQHESTKHRNQLTAICDQLFPEMTDVLKDPNSPTALGIRERFPTAQAIATATIDALSQAKGTSATKPGRAGLARLQDVAATSIGTKDVGRVRTLIFEQRQLIAELKLIREHTEQIDAEIEHIVETAREGRILMSLPGIGLTTAAAIVAAVGHVDNFPNGGFLKAYFGWAPKRTQTGTTKDSDKLPRGGERTMRALIYMAAWRCVNTDEDFAAIYKRLVARKCPCDERKRDYVGKNVVMARICGQLCRRTGVTSPYALRPGNP